MYPGLRILRRQLLLFATLRMATFCRYEGGRGGGEEGGGGRDGGGKRWGGGEMGGERGGVKEGYIM